MGIGIPARFLKGKASGVRKAIKKLDNFQISFKLRTVQQTDNYCPFEYRTSPVFGTLLYNFLNLPQLTVEDSVCVQTVQC